jgi:hypothetical protein
MTFINRIPFGNFTYRNPYLLSLPQMLAAVTTGIADLFQLVEKAMPPEMLEVEVEVKHH